MNDIFDAIPVPHYRVRRGDLAVDSSNPDSSDISNIEKKRKKRSYKDTSRARSCVGRDARVQAPGCGDGIRRHGGEKYATKDASELARGLHDDEREMDFVRVEGKGGYW